MKQEKLRSEEKSAHDLQNAKWFMVVAATHFAVQLLKYFARGTEWAGMASNVAFGTYSLLAIVALFAYLNGNRRGIWNARTYLNFAGAGLATSVVVVMSNVLGKLEWVLLPLFCCLLVAAGVIIHRFIKGTD